jgi:hypothetical protein
MSAAQIEAGFCSLMVVILVATLTVPIIRSRSPGRQAAHARAAAAFGLIATALKQDPASLQITFREIAEDPYTVFLFRVWT